MALSDLRLFGVIHMDRRGKVTDELDEFSDDVDALFIEYPPNEIALRTLLRCLLKAPLFGLGMVLMAYVHWPLYVLCQRDLVPAELLAARRLHEQRDVPLQGVDEHPVQLMADAGPWWILPNWIVLVAVLWFSRLDGLVTAVTALAVYGLVAVLARRNRRVATIVAIPVLAISAFGLVHFGYLAVPLVLGAELALLTTVGLTIAPRNRTMLRRIRRIADEEGYESACLITGRAHLSGMLKIGRENDLSITRVHRSKWLRASDATTDDPYADESSGPAVLAGTEQDVIGARIGAAVVDGVILLVVGAVAAIVGGVIGKLLVGEESSAFWWFFWVGLLFAPAIYPGFVEWRFGRSVGKAITGIAVVKKDGTRLSRRSAFVRNLLRPIDFLFFYGLDFLVMMVSERRQRIGDHAAGTVVVKRSDE